MLTLQGVSLRLGGVTLLDAFELVLPDPGVYVVNGPVASGKSLLGRLLAGRQRPQRGSLLLDGLPLYPRVGVHPGGQWFADARLVQAELETLEEYAGAELQQHGGSPWEARLLWDRLALVLPNAAQRPLGELSTGQEAAFQLALASVLPLRLFVLDGQLSLFDPEVLAWAYRLLESMHAQQTRYVICTATNLTAPLPAGLPRLQLAAHLPMRILSDSEHEALHDVKPVASEVENSVDSGAEGSLLRLKVRTPMTGQGVSSGKHFVIVARNDNWLKLRLSGSIDGMLEELSAQRVEVSALEWL